MNPAKNFWGIAFLFLKHLWYNKWSDKVFLSCVVLCFCFLSLVFWVFFFWTGVGVGGGKFLIDLYFSDILFFQTIFKFYKVCVATQNIFTLEKKVGTKWTQFLSILKKKMFYECLKLFMIETLNALWKYV